MLIYKLRACEKGNKWRAVNLLFRVLQLPTLINVNHDLPKNKNKIKILIKEKLKR